MASINTNISAYYAQNNLRASGAMAQSSIARLSSGNKIIKASDDVAALSIGTILRTDVNTLKTALVNANQGSTLLQVADGALARVGEILQRQKALATQANSGTLSATERGYLGQEFDKLSEELDRIVDRTTFNGIGLLDGNLASSGSLLSAGPAATSNYDVRSTATSFTTLTGGLNSTGFVAAGFSNTGASGTSSNSFFGSLENATVSAVYTGTASTIGINININGVDYTTTANVTTSGASAAVNFTANDGSGQTFRLSLTTLDGLTGITGPISTQAEANTAAALLQTDLRTMTIYQDRSIDTTDGITAASLVNTVLDGLDGSDFTLRGKDFTAVAGDVIDANLPSIGAFRAVSNSSSDASFYITINGVTYQNEHEAVTSTLKGDDLGAGAANGILRLTSVDDSNSYFDINLGSLTSDIDGTSQEKLQKLQDAINAALGSSEFGGVDFQVGTEADDKVSISLAAVDTDSLYVDNDGAAVTMDLVDGDLADIQEALDNAINTVTSRRADVGALQSRFNYAASALESSIQNLDAARGTFLDADISEESTAFAKAQVLQQAAISVLAQANQIPQNLLKLIG
jgi:flagellin